MLRLIIISVITFISSFGVPAHSETDQRMLVRIYVEGKDDFQRLDDMFLDFASPKFERYAEVVATNSELEEIRRRGFATEIIAYPDRVNLTDPEYHTYEELLVLMDSLANAYPDITHLDTIGGSQRMGYLIQAMKISDNPDIEEDEPALLFDGLHHAREPVGMESCLAIMDHLLSNYGIDTTVTDWVDGIEIWIVPMLNPEGWKYILEDSLSSPWWRKNQRDNNNNGIFEPNIDGVDINRNYDYNWSIGGSGNPSSWVYRGPSPFSEQEAQAKRDLALAQKFVVSISYHSYGEEVLYSWSDSLTAPDQQLISEIADSMASRIPLFYGVGHYDSRPSNCVNGFSRCWMYVVSGALEFTLETAPMFIPPGDDGLQIAQDNIQGALYLLDRVNGPGLTGHITDAATGVPISATVTIVEHSDSILTPRTSDELYGRYFRLLQPDIYTVEVSKEGYETETINTVIGSEGLTQLDFQLDSIDVSIDDKIANVPDMYALSQNYPNPFNPVTTIRYAIPVAREVFLIVYNLRGEEVARLVEGVKPAGYHEVRWNASNVASGIYFYKLQAGDFVRTRKMVLLR